jgi:hypothetical protein
MTHLLVSLALAFTLQAPADPAEPTALERLKHDAASMGGLVESPLAKAFLAGVECLPAIPTPRVVYYHKATRDALTEAAAHALTDTSQLAGYEKRDITEEFYYFTRYGSPVAFVRPLEILGRAGIKKADGLKLADFGFGSIGQIRALASLGAEAVGIDVDALLKAVYSQEGDTGTIARCPSAGKGKPGVARTVFGFFPSDAATVNEVGKGYDVFVSKNTLKRGYIHPEQEVDPRMLVHLNVDDETYVRAVFDLLKPGGYFLIYNLSPAPSKAGEPYKPWSDGRSPFAREVYERVGFEVLAFDQDDSEAARAMGNALGWAESMDLENDLFGTYTLARKTR